MSSGPRLHPYFTNLHVLDVSIIILEHNDVLSLQTANLIPQEKGRVDCFPHPFSKSCPCVVPVEYDDDDDNFIAIYMYITRHTCNGMRFAPELLHSMPTIQSFHTYSTSPKLRSYNYC